jgi:heme exporter protein D
MYWKSFSEFIDMGGYSLYVWGSYLTTAVVLGCELLMLVQRRRRALEDVRAWRTLNGDDHDAKA